ncbi:MAG: hypothetical protein JWN56_2592 [Sphingobacteriales bacterium]|nr:hypothetical protein [Sphingobacteriales bacterium]
MRFPILIIPFLPASGMALFPFILLNHRQLKTDIRVINHEKIHLRQQLELLVIPFYVLYLIDYFINLLKYKNHHRAYMNIVFEKEAYLMDHELNYLTNRKFWTWLQYFNSNINNI